MTNIEKLIAHIKTRMVRHEYTKLDWELTMLGKLLSGLPDYEENKIYEILCTEEEPKETDDAEISYKTLDSSVISVGDELTDGKFVGICVGVAGDEVNVVISDGRTGLWGTEEWKRTGRNFPAVEKILNTMNNAEVVNA